MEEVTGADLDYRVAKSERGDTETLRDFEFWKRECWEAGVDCYSTNWAQGGPIIERERIAVDPLDDGTGYWMAGVPPCYGPTPLIAAMHAYVASKG